MRIAWFLINWNSFTHFKNKADALPVYWDRVVFSRWRPCLSHLGGPIDFTISYPLQIHTFFNRIVRLTLLHRPCTWLSRNNFVKSWVLELIFSEFSSSRSGSPRIPRMFTDRPNAEHRSQLDDSRQHPKLQPDATRLLLSREMNSL